MIYRFIIHALVHQKESMLNRWKMYKSTQFWPYVYLHVGIFEELMWFDWGPIPFLSSSYPGLLPSFYKVHMSRLPDFTLNIHSLTLCPSVLQDPLLLFILANFTPTQGLCICCPFVEPLFCQIFCWCPLLTLFIHLSIREGVSWHPTYGCILYHTALLFLKELIIA